MKRYDQLMGLVLFSLGVGMTIEAIHLKLGQLARPGPGFMAFLIGVSVGLSGLILTLLATLKGKETNERIWAGQNWRNLAAIVLALLSYVVLFEYLGFLLITFLFIFFLCKLTSKEPRKWSGAIVFSVIVVLFCYLIFCLWLKISLPKGFLGIG